MHQSFKTLRNSIDSGKLPDKGSVEQFLAEASLMITYPGFGDEFYGPFKVACLKLLSFHEANDLDGFRGQITSIHTLKKQCHNRFK